MSFLLFLIGFFAAFFGLIGVIYPKIIKRRPLSRKQYLALLAAGLVAMVTGGVTGAERQPELVAAEKPAETESKPSKKVLFDLQEIVLKSKNQVELFTGKPVKPCETGKYGLSCTYQAGETEVDVVYINDVADWITLKNQNFQSFSIPQQLGFDYQKASGQTLDTINYQNAYGVQEMTVFLAGGKVDYVYIKAKTH